MIFGLGPAFPLCAVTLAGSSLPIVKEYTYLGVVLTSSVLAPSCATSHFTWNRLFAQCVSWCRSDRPAIRLLDGAMRRWGRHLLGWRSGSPNAAVFLELGGQTLCTSAQNTSCLSSGVLFPCALCRLSFSELPCPSRVHGRVCGIGPLSSAHCVQAWFQTHAAPFLSCCCCFPALSLPCPCLVTCGERWSASNRVWTFFHSFSRSFLGLARWGYDPFPGGRAARHLGLSLSCVLCGAPSGDLFHCLFECPAFIGPSGPVVPSVFHPPIPSLSGLATLGSSFPAPLSTLSAQSAPMSRLLGRSASVSSHCDTLIPLRGSSSSFFEVVCFQLFSLPRLGGLLSTC